MKMKIINVGELSFSEWLELCQGVEGAYFDNNYYGSYADDLYQWYECDINFAKWLESEKHICFLINNKNELVNMNRRECDLFYNMYLESGHF